ncbi:MAG TPA: prolyl oligopeptidase family serine peptidase, partial [Candidatus Eisenbacteria bacterium]|nr:prolyl oligopeptidase family serine peptidase [Candidatus Eisenbacteria bacterium]
TDVELWMLDVQSARARRLGNFRVNPLLGAAVYWMPDQKTLLVRSVPSKRPPAPSEPSVPPGPRIEESGGKGPASSTYEARDLLRTPHDADLFEYYATSQLVLVDVASGKMRPLGSPGVLTRVLPAPGGEYVLVERVQRPYSFLRAYDRFPTEIEIWDLSGKKVETLASLPLAEQVPIRGVRTGVRSVQWRPTAPATLYWAEALDDGDTFKDVPHHDRVMLKTVGSKPIELMKTEKRYGGMNVIEHGSKTLVYEVDDDKHWLKAHLLDMDKPTETPRLVWSLSFDDIYNEPGNPVYHVSSNGTLAVREENGAIFLAGEGASPEGNRPFLDRMDLATLKTERLFRSDHESLESFLEWVDPAAGTFLTRRESPKDPPSVYRRTLGAKASGAPAAGEALYASTAEPITHVTDPVPQVRRISKQLVKYKRADGVELSFTLYLPPDYKKGTRLPTVVWAYPLDYTDPSMAGQVDASPMQFTNIVGASPLFFALLGYAVLHDTAMPVVGPSETAYDTFIEQVVANAKAAVDKAVELGVTDPDRVGVMGHSHGALMTANLLAWSDLFRAGVARSGAYNHTMRPFGFQNERRTLYKARDNYIKLSPLLNADKIDEPLLIIHGEIDANPGTVPLQSEKLFEAVRGVGGTTRLVMLPYESHGYASRESNQHVLYEMTRWFDKYVKNASPRERRAEVGEAIQR